MSKNNGDEFQYFEITNGEDVLALLGSDGIRSYGVDGNGEEIENGHFHNLLEIGICRWGYGTLTFGKNKIPYKNGTIVIIPKNHSHSVKNREGEKSFWEYLYINPAVFLETRSGMDKYEIRNYLEQIEKRVFVKQREELPILASEVDLIMDQIRMQEYGYRNCVRGLVYALLMEIVKINHEEFEQYQGKDMTNETDILKIYRALDFIDENFAREIRAADIARAAYVSETNLRQMFGNYCGMPPMQYVNLVRIKAACKLILKYDSNINETAYKVGFSNISTFINNFKLYVGETPKQWKKKMNSAEKKLSDYDIFAQIIKR